MNKVHKKTVLMTMEPTKKNVLMRISFEELKAKQKLIGIKKFKSSIIEENYKYIEQQTDERNDEGLI